MNEPKRRVFWTAFSSFVCLSVCTSHTQRWLGEDKWIQFSPLLRLRTFKRSNWCCLDGQIERDLTLDQQGSNKEDGQICSLIKPMRVEGKLPACMCVCNRPLETRAGRRDGWSSFIFSLHPLTWGEQNKWDCRRSRHFSIIEKRSLLIMVQTIILRRSVSTDRRLSCSTRLSLAHTIELILQTNTSNLSKLITRWLLRDDRSPSCRPSECVCPLIDFFSSHAHHTSNEPFLYLGCLKSAGDWKIYEHWLESVSWVLWSYGWSIVHRAKVWTNVYASFIFTIQHEKLSTSRLASIYLNVNMSLALIRGVMIVMRRTGQEAFLMFSRTMSALIRCERRVNNNNNINVDTICYFFFVHRHYDAWFHSADWHSASQIRPPTSNDMKKNQSLNVSIKTF